MRRITYEALPWKPSFGGRGSNGQAERAEYKSLFVGSSSKPGNFECMITRRPITVHTPRHRHHFDQVRYVFAGSENISPGRDIPARCLGFFPEGTFYGPEVKEPGCEQLVIQYEGASKSGFAHYTELRQAREELEKRGEFKNGAYVWVDERGSTQSKDAHQAAWEKATGRSAKYPESRFDSPIVVFPDNFEWLPAGSGVKKKDLGTFGEGLTTIRMVAVNTASWRLAAEGRRTIAVVARGGGSIAGQSVVERDAVCLEPGEHAEISATGEIELLAIGLPCLD